MSLDGTTLSQHNPARLMPSDNRAWWQLAHKRSSIVLEVAAAYTGSFHLKDNLIRPGRWVWKLHQRYSLVPWKHRTFHDQFAPLKD
jgi:hypothetical protein